MMPLRIVVHNTTLDPAARADIRERVDHLSRFYPRIQSCRVTIDAPQRRRRTDRLLFGIRLVLTVPQGQLAIARQPRRTLTTALDEAFQAARRRLQDHARRLRGAQKVHALPARGRVTEWYPMAGYGFLETADGDRYYFDRRAVLGEMADRFDVGTTVRFAPGDGERGPQATSLAPLHPRAGVAAS